MSLTTNDLQNIKSTIKVEMKSINTKIDKAEKDIESVDKRIKNIIISIPLQGNKRGLLHLPENYNDSDLKIILKYLNAYRTLI